MALPDTSPVDAASRREGTRRRAEAAVLVTLGVALLALAAWSVARAGDATPDAPGASVDLAAARNDALLVLGGALAAAVVVVVVPTLRWSRGRRSAEADEERAPWWLRVLVVSGFLLVVIAIGGAISSLDDGEQVDPTPAAPPTSEPTAAELPEPAGAQGWGAVALVAAGAIAVGAAALVWHGRSRPRDAHGTHDDLAVAAPLEPRDLEALAPGDAVRAAYAASRVAVMPLGVAPREAEAPYEYLARVREGAPTAAVPMATLTTLFELARFSHHPVTASMKADAIVALRTIIDGIAEALERSETA